MKIDKPGQHLDHLLRTTRTHHIQLSSMADMKANMLLTMSAIVITLAAPQVFKLDFQWPFLVLIVSSLLTIGLATYAVMPRIPLAQKDQPAPDVRSPQFNLLFFGDFTRLPYSEFETAMEEVLNDPLGFMKRRHGKFICWVLSSPGRNTVSSGWRTCHSLPGRVLLSCC